MYLFVKANPGCTRADVAKGCALRTSSATARVKDLIDGGFILESAERRYNRVSGRSGKKLYAAEDREHKAPRDKVRIEVTLMVDEDGNYLAKARVLGDSAVAKSSKKTVNVVWKDITVEAPFPEEYKHHFFATEGGTTHEVPLSDTLANARLIVDDS